jgi:GNAT superfamily N-acetyltransferase
MRQIIVGRVINLVPAARADDTAYVSAVAELVNAVSAAAEAGLWQPGADRTNPAEVAGYIRAGELAEAEGLAGVVRVRRLDASLGEFGMLVADPGRRGEGIGSGLVAYAEKWAVDRGLRRMQLELLMPRTWTHPVKERLRQWYTRIGYERVSTADFAADYPELAPKLATPCDYVIFHKEL